MRIKLFFNKFEKLIYFLGSFVRVGILRNVYVSYLLEFIRNITYLFIIDFV